MLFPDNFLLFMLAGPSDVQGSFGAVGTTARLGPITTIPDSGPRKQRLLAAQFPKHGGPSYFFNISYRYFKAHAIGHPSGN